MNIVAQSNQRGGSLIALSFLLLILSFAITAGLYLYKNYTLIEDDQMSADNSRAIQDAIADFVDREGRYPCPAALDAEIDTPGFGQETDCVNAIAPGSGTYQVDGRDGEKVRIGAVPTRALNISDTKMVDGYNKRYIYIITERMAQPGVPVNTEQGAISLINEVEGEKYSISKVEGNVVYAIISYDKDDRGAYDIDGKLLEPCQAGTTAGNNCRFQIDPSATAEFTVKSSKTYDVGSESFSHNFAFFSNEVPYKWHTGPWSECGLPGDVCFVGGQERTVDCRDENGQVATDESLCSAHTDEPKDFRHCALPPCRWGTPGTWGSCGAVF